VLLFIRADLYASLVPFGNDNDNDKRLGLTAKADQPDHKKIQYTKNKTDNEAVQKTRVKSKRRISFTE